MGLGTDGRLDNQGVEGVRNQTDDNVVLRKLSIQGLLVGNVERDRVGILDTG